ncbi:Uncharacterised protein [Moraxella lacunata]|uniref:Uncharacterized protein n=1 Tax=Moraxella lacunata TaxID=477 RepID=A0A378TRV8_MORLA|nr:hypothetical protein [Moraxella lacunata]STZ63516.1 Uncharacterised protein [Moraxella lacunata]
MYLFRTEENDYDDYDDIGFSDDELCSICKQPFIYVGHSIDDICLECDDSIPDP